MSPTPRLSVSPTLKNMIRIVLADDHTMVREGLRERLAQAEGLDVIGEAADGREALRLAQALEPDVLILDMEMPELTGAEVARRLQEAQSPVRILALSAYDDAEYIAELLDTGAAGYFTKEENLDTIVAAVRGIAAGEQGWLSRRVAATVMRLQRDGAPEPDHGLSEREVEVLRYVAEGQTNPQIAEVLFLSEHTVRNHLANIYSKLGLRNRVEAVAWAWRNGLITPE